MLMSTCLDPPRGGEKETEREENFPTRNAILLMLYELAFIQGIYWQTWSKSKGCPQESCHILEAIVIIPTIFNSFIISVITLLLLKEVNPHFGSDPLPLEALALKLFCKMSQYLPFQLLTGEPESSLGGMKKFKNDIISTNESFNYRIN